LVGKSPSFPTQPLPPTPTNHTILACLSMTPLLVWTTSLACFMGNRLPSPLLTTRLRPTLPLLIPGVVRLPNLPVLPAFLARQSSPPSPSMSTVSGPTSKVTLMKAVDELVWANSQMLGCRGIFTVGLLQPLEFDVAVRGPKTG